MSSIVDKYGLVKAGELLTVYIPATHRALIFRVLGRANYHAEVLNYGELPITTSTSLSSFDGGTATPPADGVMPGRSYTGPLQFPYANASVYDQTDMWYVPEDYHDRLFHVLTDVTPKWLRVGVEIPTGVTQEYFQKTKVPLGIQYDWGWSRGHVEMVHIPKLRYGYRFGNDTNIDVYTNVRFTYAEYIVKIPTDGQLIHDVLTTEEPSHWVTMPVVSYDPTIRSALIHDYGFEGFPLYPSNKKDAAIAVYNELAKRAPEGVRE